MYSQNFILATLFVVLSAIGLVSCLYYGYILGAAALFSLSLGIMLGVKISYLILGVFLVFSIFFAHKIILTESTKVNFIFLDGRVLINKKNLSVIKDGFISGPFGYFLLGDYSEKELEDIKKAVKMLNKSGIIIDKASVNKSSDSVINYAKKSNLKIVTSDSIIISKAKSAKVRLIDLEKAISSFERSLN